MVSTIHGALPSCVGGDLYAGSTRLKQQGGLATVHMAEPIFSEMPQQYGYGVLALL